MIDTKERAKQLVYEFMLYEFNKIELDKDSVKYNIQYKINRDLAIECAIIAVNMIIEQWEYIDTYLANGNGEFNYNLKYWQEVRQEIQKI